MRASKNGKSLNADFEVHLEAGRLFIVLMSMGQSVQGRCTRPRDMQAHGIIEPNFGP